MMKVLKIILVVFAVVVVLVTAGLYIFLKTFDVNKFLPQITAQATQAIGRDLKIGRAELGFSFLNGIGLQVRDIVMADDPKFSDKPFLTVEKVDVGLNVGALILQQKIQLARVVVVSPQVVIIRSKEGLINAATIGPKSPASSVPSSQTPSNPAAGIPALLVNDIQVTGARVMYVDEMFAPRLAIQVERIDVNVRDFSFARPFGVTVKAALFSADQDVAINSQVALDLSKQAADIRQMNVQVELAKFDAVRMENELPMLKPLSLKKLEGVFSLSLADMQVSAQGLAGLKGEAVLNKGLVLSSLFPIPVESIQVQAVLDEKMIHVKAFSYMLAEGTDHGTALVSDYLTNPSVTATFDAQAINIKKLAEGYKSPISMSGLISATGDLKFSGKSPEEIFSSLSGHVKGELKNGVLENVNLIALGLGNIPMLPGLLDSVMADLPAETQDEVKKGMTRFETCKAQANIVNGVLQLDAADITTRDLSVHATGTVKLVESLSIKADIRMDKDLSARLESRVKELVYLNDSDGKIYLPMTLTGPVVKPVFIPDVEYLTKKLVMAAGGEKLQKALGGSPAAAEAVGAIFDLFKKK
jgi:uncharacterized protein involved in outer membrane biogenesis